jgi:hypothetical protein
VENLDYTRSARTCLFIQRLFAYKNGERTQGEITPEFMSDFRKDLAVALRLVALVVDVACFLHFHTATERIVLEKRKAGSAEGKVASNYILCHE